MRTSRPWLFASMLAVCVAAPALFSGVAWAEKVVVFKNGKAMRVKSVTPDGKWLKCQFEDDNFISVPAAHVKGIEDALLGSTGSGYAANKVAEGGRGGSLPPGFPQRGRAGIPPDNAGADEVTDEGKEADIQEALAQQQAARQEAALAARKGALGSRLKVGAPGIQPALQPLNQVRKPFQGRRGLSPRNVGLPVAGGAQSQEEED